MPAKTPIYLKTPTGRKGRKLRLRDVLSGDMISPPLGDVRHSAHVGLQGLGDMFGDVSFLQGNMDMLPPPNGHRSCPQALHHHQGPQALWTTTSLPLLLAQEEAPPKPPRLHLDTPPQHEPAPWRHLDTPPQHEPAPWRHLDTPPQHEPAPWRHLDTPPQHEPAPWRHLDTPPQHEPAPWRHLDTPPQHEPAPWRHLDTPPQHEPAPWRHLDTPPQHEPAPWRHLDTPPQHEPAPWRHLDTPPQHEPTSWTHLDTPLQHGSAPCTRSRDISLSPTIRRLVPSSNSSSEDSFLDTCGPLEVPQGLSLDSDAGLSNEDLHSAGSPLPPPDTSTLPRSESIMAALDLDLGPSIMDDVLRIMDRYRGPSPALGP
ncbi:uncharacterized protein [Eucyclogobius newberryi]|uniref:uncharacterized protein n=1 Tax=Eucyclogobius newberryi TaxID=166745 RepID=UPI003B5C6D66